MVQPTKGMIAAFYIQLMEAQTGALLGSSPEPDTEERESTASGSGTSTPSDDIHVFWKHLSCLKHSLWIEAREILLLGR